MTSLIPRERLRYKKIFRKTETAFNFKKYYRLSQMPMKINVAGGYVLQNSESKISYSESNGGENYLF